MKCESTAAQVQCSGTMPNGRTMETMTQSPDTIAAEQTLATKLLHSVMTKTFLEILAVCVIAAFAAWQHFNPQLRGAVDQADEVRVAGWAADPLRFDERIEVQLFIDGKFAATRVADESRDDLVRAGATKHPQHGFTFLLDSLRLAPGAHNVQVYALRPSSESTRILLPLSDKTLTIQIR